MSCFSSPIHQSSTTFLVLERVIHQLDGDLERFCGINVAASTKQAESKIVRNYLVLRL